MMNLTIETNNLPENQSFKDFIYSLVTKAFAKKKSIKSLLVVVSRNKDARVPFHVELNLEEENEQLLTTKAESANYIAAFSQALTRMERQLEKRA